jgi:imidazole glycerol phosphate synthase glutamine amidotransferase subunit
MITVIDYRRGGNVFSVVNSLNSLGIDSKLSCDPNDIKKASKILFPGVGSFQTAIDQLELLGLKEIIYQKALDGTWFLGICVGMQVLFEHGAESTSQEGSKGLGIIPGSVKKFSNQAPKIPHMGWNQINFLDQFSNPLFKGISEKEDFYFVHSFRAGSENIQLIKDKFPKSNFIVSEFGDEFISSWWNGEKLFVCQFHPEKSGENGLKILENFANL